MLKHTALTRVEPGLVRRCRLTGATWCGGAVLAFALTACGGGGSGSGAASVPPLPLPPLGAGESALDDPTAYSAAPDAGLADAADAVATTRHQITLGGTTLAYTARAGHLVARDLATDAAEASMFFVAYTLDGADARQRPVTFFYNGGPGSSSVWLHLGSFGPQRLVTGVPATTAVAPFPLVSNSESLLDVTDMVFVNAVGTGLSEAILPYTNRSFWGVDTDAAVFRDFIKRWLQVNGRTASPSYLYGESYGGPRTAVLAGLLQSAGVPLQAVVLQSPALDYNNNCGVTGTGNCAPFLPTYGAAGAWYGRVSPVPASVPDFMASLRGFTDTQYAPALAAFLRGAAIPPALPPLLQANTGIAAGVWQVDFNLQPGRFQQLLQDGEIIGRYDARMHAPLGSALAAEGDPSSTFLTASFAAGIATTLRDTLRYTNASTYVLLGNAIEQWDFRHAGRVLPDTVPDLGAALVQNPGLQVLAVGGYHDLATPFHVTEQDLARLGTQPRIQLRWYPGGHMSYLDDATRVLQKGDLAGFYKTNAALLAAQPGLLYAAMSGKPMPPSKTAAATVSLPPSEAQIDLPGARPMAELAVQTKLRDPSVPVQWAKAARQAAVAATPP